MKLLRRAGATSEIWQIFIADSSSTTGAGLTALTNASSGLTAYYHRDTDTTATAISLVSMTVGTFTSSGFKEIDATNMPGWYQFCPPNAALASGAKSCGFHLKGVTNMAPLPIEVDLDGQVDVYLWNGTAVASPATAGIPDVNVKNMNNVAATSITTINANVGQTQPVNFTGTGGSALVKSDTVDIAGAAVSTSTAQIGVNVVNAGGTAWASGSLSSGVFASGAINRAALAADTGLQPVRSNTAAAGASTTITLDASASATDSFYKEQRVYITGGTGAGQDRLITAYVGSTKVATISPAWTTNPDNTSTFAILPDATADLETILGTASAGAAGYVGPDWGHVNAPTTTVNLSGTTVATVTNQLTAAAIATGVWQDTTAGDFTVASSIGKSLYTSGAVPGAAGGLFIAGTNAATTVTTSFTTTFTGNLTGSVGSVTGNVGGNVTGSVGSVVGAVGSVTGNVGGNVVGSVASVTAAVTLSAGDSPVIQTGTAAAGGASTITIATALGTTADIVGCKVKITSGTGANQERVITAYNNGTKVVTVDYAWVTNPDNTSVYAVLFDNAPVLTSALAVTAATTGGTVAANVTQWLGTAVSTPTVAGVPNVNAKTWNDLATVALPLTPTVAGRTLDVSAGGEAGLDWANVGSPTTTNALTGTTIASTQKVDVDTIKTNAVVNGGTITFPTNATLASTTNITAGTVTTATNVTTVNGLASNVITAASINADAITAAKIADGAIDRATFAADTGLQTIRSNTAAAGASTTITLDAAASAVDSFYNWCLVRITGGTGAGQVREILGYVGSTQVATVRAWATNPDNTSTFAILDGVSVWDDVTASHLTSGSTGNSLNAAGSAGDPWGTSLPGAYGAGTAGFIVGTNLNATVSSRSTLTQTQVTGGAYSVQSSSCVLGDARIANLDAAVSSRMATYTQPTGFLAATFPGTVASTTNITAGTVTTVSGNVTGSVGSVTARVTANTDQWAGNPVASSLAGVPDVNVSYWAGADAMKDTHGYPSVNVVDIAGAASAGAAGSVGIDWAHVANPTSTVGLTNTTISSTQTPATPAAIATAVWQDATAGDFAAAGSIGKSLFTAGVVPGANGGLLIAGSNAATTFASGSHFVGTVDTVTTYTGNTPQTGDAFARIGATGSGLTSLAPSATALSTAQWTNGRAANLDDLDAAVSTRLPTSGYTAPPAATANADTLLGRNIAGGSSTGRTVTQALATIRNKVVISGTTLTVYDTDDSTILYQATLTAAPGADPIGAVDPTT